MIFKKKDEELYLFTNYKVMWTTFNGKESLGSKGVQQKIDLALKQKMGYVI